MDMPREQKRLTTRRHLWAILHEGRGRMGHAFNFLLIPLILLSVAILPLEYLPTARAYINVIHTIESVVVALFTVEYLLRVYAAPSRLRYIFSFFGIIDLLSIAPFYTGIFGTEYIRAIRLIRFFKLAEIEAAAQNDEEDAQRKDVGLVEGEHVEYIISRSPMVLFLGIIPPLIAITFGVGVFVASEPGNATAIAITLSLFLFAGIFLWKAWLDFSYDVIYITNFRLIFQNQHLLGRSVNQVQYHAITNVKPYYPNVFSYVLRFGSLTIDTAAEVHGQISLSMVRKHEHAAHLIMQKCFAAQQRPPEPPTPVLGGM